MVLRDIRETGGFTLVELLITIGIIALLATVATILVVPGVGRARDTRRKVDVSQIGRLLAARCFTPAAGPGDYDLSDIVNELKAKYPNYSAILAQQPLDPSRGTPAASFYRYAVSSSGRCAVYANLENQDEPITLPGIAAPGPGAGTGVINASSAGWNGSSKYFEFSN